MTDLEQSCIYSLILLLSRIDVIDLSLGIIDCLAIELFLNGNRLPLLIYLVDTLKGQGQDKVEGKYESK
jgi:hypothetical protein